MSSGLKNRRALASSSVQNAGEAVVRAYVAASADVAPTDINVEVLSGLHGVDEIRSQVLDATDSHSIAAAEDVVTSINSLVNYAGNVQHGSALDCSNLVEKQHFDQNVETMFLITGAILTRMRTLSSGSLVNISSICAAGKNRCNVQYSGLGF